jgi:hypothetical protein
MGFFSTILGFCGFGFGISIGLVAGYFLFIYFQPSDVQVPLFFSLYMCIHAHTYYVHIYIALCCLICVCVCVYILIWNWSYSFCNALFGWRGKDEKRKRSSNT